MKTVPLNVAVSSTALALTPMVAAYLYMNRCIVVQIPHINKTIRTWIDSFFFFFLKIQSIIPLSLIFILVDPCSFVDCSSCFYFFLFPFFQNYQLQGLTLPRSRVFVVFNFLVLVFLVMLLLEVIFFFDVVSDVVSFSVDILFIFLARP